ncbi:hypothetical protein [Cellulomonas rhizosphaerae]|uniref:Uncharacterized protein n=1 Tax=Cellulomonas rhizosphaerae TaxID=2293719 RepID=A0A413RJG0_9CELL|nr:hypothetical protein [Cellulomonas rhizosphaerae]RHA38719.1 hypothetical protein D1825_13375 [Cellulomonas rhizosphaerae]
MARDEDAQPGWSYEPHGYELLGWFVPGDTAPTPDAVPVMGGTLRQPRNYMTRKGPARVAAEPTWPDPHYLHIGDGHVYYEDPMPWADGSRWGLSHWTLTSEGPVAMFVGRIWEGRAVGYPWRHVIWFAWHHRRSYRRKRP